jgi:hypothetical protein
MPEAEDSLRERISQPIYVICVPRMRYRRRIPPCDGARAL